MLAVQLATITALLAMAILFTYSAAGSSASEVKTAFIKAENKYFIEQSFKTLLAQVLESSGETCIEKKQVAANALKTLAKTLASSGVVLKVGFASDLKTCDCHDPWETVSINDVETSAAEAVLSCVGNKLEIANAGIDGFAVVRFEMQSTGQRVTLNYGDVNAG